jgi:hypothetical protein
MTQKDFNSAFGDLMSQPSSPAPDPRWIASEILRRDRMRTRILAGLTLFFWLIGVSGMLLLVFALNDFVMFIRLRGGDAHSQMANILGTQLIHECLPWVSGSIVALMLAALFTVLLVLTSRQATLNSINISLWQMAEQLKQIRPPADQTLLQHPIGQATAPLRAESTLPVKLIWAGCIVALLAIMGVVAALTIVRTGRGIWSGYPHLAPYEAIQWRDQTPVVKISGKWYDLIAINDIPVHQIISESRSLDENTWQKHFNEDLVELMTRMGYEPGTTVKLTVNDLSARTTLVLNDVPMTEDNRLAIWDAGVTEVPIGLPATQPTTAP